MTQNDITAFAKKNGYEGARNGGEWRGFQVWQPYVKPINGVIPPTGLPLVILVQGQSVRMSTINEALQYIGKNKRFDII